MFAKILSTIRNLDVTTLFLKLLTSNLCLVSDNGAHQISQDFGALRAWIAENEHIKEESRRYLLLLDAIRRCEGVARLLQSKPGETVDVKPSKNRVVPINVPGSFCYELFAVFA